MKKLSYTHLNTVLDYETIGVLTGIKNHIQNNITNFIGRYINILVKKKKKEEKIRDKYKDEKKQKEKLHEYRAELRKIKTDIYFNNDECLKKYNKIKLSIREILPDTIKEKGLMYEVIKNPLSFLKGLIQISKIIEGKKEKTFSCFPLRKSVIPSYIRLDTTTLVHLLYEQYNVAKPPREYYLTNGRTFGMREKIWKWFFKTGKRTFSRKKYTFNYSIETDGVGCSIIFIRNDLYDPVKVARIRHLRKPTNYRSEKYVDQLTDNEKINIKIIK